MAHTVTTLYSHQPRTLSITYETVTIHMFCLSVIITSINSVLLIGVCLMLGCSLVCLLFHVTIIISLFFMLLLTMVLFYSALYHARLLHVFNKIFIHSFIHSFTFIVWD